MRLHEYYFDNLGGKSPLGEDSSLYRALVENFGSFDMWKSDYISTAMMRGIGWVILCRDPKNSRLINVWIAEHDLGHLAGATPILVLDVWEHAFITQYGLDRASYINAFFKNVNWDVVQARLSQP
jgi:Fe-Mn family superoxide dismutase